MKNYIFKIFSTNKDKNLAFHVTNDTKGVINARKELCNKHNLNYTNLKYMNQIHSNIVCIVNKKQNLYDCDALISNLKDTPLMVMVADCIPILFYDEINSVIGVAHAGRNGTFMNIAQNTINSMIANFKCNIKNIKVILGPSIQKCCYEVSQELASIVINNFGIKFENNRYIDLQGINKKQLLDIGVIKENISISDICTKCSNKPYFSYRKDKNCGRFVGLISLGKI